MTNISHILEENEVELTDGDLAAVQGGAHNHWGGNHWGGGPSWYGGPAYGYGYGFAPEPQVVYVVQQPTAPTVLETQPVSTLPA